MYSRVILQQPFRQDCCICTVELYFSSHLDKPFVNSYHHYYLQTLLLLANSIISCKLVFSCTPYCHHLWIYHRNVLFLACHFFLFDSRSHGIPPCYLGLKRTLLMTWRASKIHQHGSGDLFLVGEKETPLTNTTLSLK